MNRDVTFEWVKLLLVYTVMLAMDAGLAVILWKKATGVESPDVSIHMGGERVAEASPEVLVVLGAASIAVLLIGVFVRVRLLTVVSLAQRRLLHRNASCQVRLDTLARSFTFRTATCLAMGEAAYLYGFMMGYLSGKFFVAAPPMVAGMALILASVPRRSLAQEAQRLLLEEGAVLPDSRP